MWFAEAIRAYPTVPDYYAHRATAALRLERCAESHPCGRSVFHGGRESVSHVSRYVSRAGRYAAAMPAVVGGVERSTCEYALTARAGTPRPSPI